MHTWGQVRGCEEGATRLRDNNIAENLWRWQQTITLNTVYVSTEASQRLQEVGLPVSVCILQRGKLRPHHEAAPGGPVPDHGPTRPLGPFLLSHRATPPHRTSSSPWVRVRQETMARWPVASSSCEPGWPEAIPEMGVPSSSQQIRFLTPMTFRICIRWSQPEPLEALLKKC